MTSLVLSSVTLTVIAAAATTTFTSIFGGNNDVGVVESTKSTFPSFFLRKNLVVNSLYPSSSDVHDKTSSLYTEEALANQVTSLPGLGYDPGFNQFSGYLKVSEENDRNIFYWYVESQNDPENDPVVFWTNGGPGCSGLLGFATEHGPYILSQDGSLKPNPYSWNKVANMLYVEQPAGVGFSYSNTEEDYTTVGDDRAAVDNLKLIQEFFKRFPERKNNDFYISSESYGGHYIPQLALQILNHNANNDINFSGFIVGNPYVDPFSNYVTQMEAYYSHGLIAKPLFDLWAASCSTLEAYDPKACNSLSRAMFQEMGPGINPYALDYPRCTKETANDFQALQAASLQGMTLLQRSQFGLVEDDNNDRILLNPPFLPSQDRYNPCAEAYTLDYLNRKDVRDAIGVKVDKEWVVCTRDIKYSRDDANTPQVNLYIELLQKAMDSADKALNMMIFSGDDDSICSTAGTQAWIYDLGVRPLPDDFWKAWEFNEQTAGYVTKFDLGENVTSSFTFVTVHGAGHEVPAYRPMEALEMFKKYLSGKW